LLPSELLGTACFAFGDLRQLTDKYGDPGGNREELPLLLVRPGNGGGGSGGSGGAAPIAAGFLDAFVGLRPAGTPGALVPVATSVATSVAAGGVGRGGGGGGGREPSSTGPFGGSAPAFKATASMEGANDVAHTENEVWQMLADFIERFNTEGKAQNKKANKKSFAATGLRGLFKEMDADNSGKVGL
jgi:hypothetical protein